LFAALGRTLAARLETPVGETSSFFSTLAANEAQFLRKFEQSAFDVNLKRSIFRDPAAIPKLKQIAESLRVKGYEVTEPKPGKACHGACRVIFTDVENWKLEKR